MKPKPHHHLRRGVLTLLSLGFSLLVLRAQPASSPVEGDTTVVLPAFTVSASKDRGYQAGNSVSATRVDTPIKDLPFSVSAFTEQFVDDIGARDLYDVVKFAPGVTTASREFVSGNTRYSIRGFDQLLPQRNGFVGSAYVDATTIQRVEVVKGPASVLYGQIAPGGTVNYITKRPQEATFLRLSQQAGNAGYLRSELDANVATGGNRLLFRVNGSWDNAFEEIGDATTETTVLAPSVTWKPTANSALTVEYEKFSRREDAMVSPLPTMSLSLTSDTATALTAYAAGEAQAQQNRGSLSFYPLSRDFNYSGKHDYRDSTFETLNVEYASALGEHWTARANYNWNRRRVDQKLTGIASVALTKPAGETAASFAQRLLNDPNAALEAAAATLTRRKRYAEDYGYSEAYQVEAAGSYKISSISLKPLIGAYYLRNLGRTIVWQSNANPPAGLANASTTAAQGFQPWNMKDPSTWDTTTDYDEHALPIVASGGNTRVFAKDTGYYAVLSATAMEERFHLIAGARYNETESSAYDHGTGRSTPANPPYKAHKITPQFGAGYKVTPDVLLYASYSESFAVTERVLQEASVITGAAKPTTASGYDIGVKADLWDGKLSSTVSLFRIEQKDRVLRFGSFNAAGGVLTTTRQGTEDRSQGFEIETILSPVKNWQIYASYSHMDAELVSAAFPSAPAPNTTLAAYKADPAGYTAAFTQGYNDAVARYVGSQPEASASELLNLWTRYSFTEGTLSGLWLGGGLNHTSSKPQLVGNLQLFLPSYTTYDLAAGYDWKDSSRQYTLQVNWKNLTDEEYIPANQLRGERDRIYATFAVKF
ncbi:MAG: TonB-dependent siderophore receptor [Verrucomicrobiota bacterium]